MAVTLLVYVKGGPGSGNWGHAGRPGLVGGSTSSRSTYRGMLNYIVSSGVLDPDMENELPGSTQLLARALEGVPTRHMDGLEEITFKPPAEYDMDDAAYINANGGRCIGVYVGRTKSIHVHPDALVSDSAKLVLTHELGHHKTRHSLGWKSSLSKLTKATKEMLAAGDMSQRDMADMGLRRYSLRDGGELLADSYFVWARGSDTQWANLNGYVMSSMGSNFDMTRLFGERLK